MFLFTSKYSIYTSKDLSIVSKIKANHFISVQIFLDAPRPFIEPDFFKISRLVMLEKIGFCIILKGPMKFGQWPSLITRLF